MIFLSPFDKKYNGPNIYVQNGTEQRILAIIDIIIVFATAVIIVIIIIKTVLIVVEVVR